MSVIKGVILGELGFNSTTTYLDYISDVSLLSEGYDIEIIYNHLFKYDFNYSFETTTPNDKYDFISIAIRDILIGLGISSSYRYNPAIDGLQNPSQQMTPFEYAINKALGINKTPQERLTKATSGSLQLSDNSTKRLSLYAPAQWTSGVSLNCFIP